MNTCEYTLYSKLLLKPGSHVIMRHMKNEREILQNALAERVSVNHRYSLRAFARDIGLSPQQLSNVMNGRRGLSPELAEKIASQINLSELEKTIFLESLKAKFARRKSERAIAKGKIQSLKAQGEVKGLEIDLFRVISNWYHFAIVELIKISEEKTQKAAHFATKLGITLSETHAALERLERVELITKTKSGWTANQDITVTDHALPSEAVRKFHKQILEKSIQALTLQTASERYGSSSTLPIKVKDVARAKKLIQDFRIAFDQEISDSENGEEVYALSLQFFRVTEKE